MSDANLNDPQVAADYDLIYADWDTHVDRLVQIMNGHLPVVPRYAARLHLRLRTLAGRGAQDRLGRDRSRPLPAMLQRARGRLPDVEYTTIDVRSLDQVFEARFDAVISVGNALPMLSAASFLWRCRRCGHASRAAAPDGGDP